MKVSYLFTVYVEITDPDPKGPKIIDPTNPDPERLFQFMIC